MAFRKRLHMKYLILALLLCGCSTAPKPTPLPIEPQTKEKDQYITKVESVVSDSASALTAVVPVLAKGTVREVVEAQVTRLSGVAKPSVAKVEEFKRIISSNDTKAVEQDKKEASKVDEETTALYAMVEQKDFEIMEAHARADAEFKQKVLWQFSTAGLGLFIVGVLVTAFTPLKKSGGIVMGGGMLAMASLWLFDSEWFTYIAATSVGIVVFSLVLMLAKNLFTKRPIDNAPATSKVDGDLG
jgi:hypothetical protein